MGKDQVKTPNQPLPGLGGQNQGRAPVLPGLGAGAGVDAKRVMTGYQLERAMNEAIEHHKAGRREEAEGLYRFILQQVPDQPDALNLLGILAVEAGKKEMAVELIGRALARRPNDPNIQNNLGNALFMQRRYDEAQELFEQAVVGKEDFIEAIFNLAKTLRGKGELSESRFYYERVLNLQENHPASAAGVAHTFEDEGDLKKAEQCYLEIIKKHPDRPHGYRGLSHVRKWKGDEPEIESMVEFFGNESARPSDRIAMAYALGKLHDDLRDYDKAFEYYKFANDNSGIKHDAEAVVRNINEYIQTYSPEFLAENFGNGHPTEKPIFVVGMPRSGTTLTEQIFASHREVHGAGELEYMARTWRRGLSMANNGGIGALGKEAWRILGQYYIGLAEQKNPVARRIVDKMPHNYEQLGLISLALPKAKVIHIKRQAPDTCLSCFMHDFNEFHSYNRNLSDAGHYYRQYERLMEHWKEVLPIEVFQLKYEALVSDPEATIRKMLDFAELDWDENCLNFHKLKRNVATPSNTQVTQPMYKKSKDRWRNYEKNLGPLLEALEWEGYGAQKGAAE